MSRSTFSLVVAVLGTIALAYVMGIGGLGRSSHGSPYPPGPPVAGGGEPGLEPLPKAVDGVRTLYDDSWTVEEGQWWIGNAETYSGSGVSFKRLLESSGTQAVSITTPGLYGRYRTTLQLLDAEPELPAWCEDAAEASIHLDAHPNALQMGSFESFSDPVGVPAGWYRVRYCAEKQDVAAGQEEFTGDQYTTYAGRHLIQLWQAPRAPDRTLRTGSDWARNLAHGG